MPRKSLKLKKKSTSKRVQRRRKSSKRIQKRSQRKYKFGGDEDFSSIMKSDEMSQKRDNNIRMYIEYFDMFEKIMKNEPVMKYGFSIKSLFELLTSIVKARANEMNQEHFGRQVRGIRTINSFPTESRQEQESYESYVSEKSFHKLTDIILEYLYLYTQTTNTSYNPYEEMQYDDTFRTIFENMIDLVRQKYEQDSDDSIGDVLSSLVTQI